MSKIIPRENPCYCIRIRRAENALTKFYDRAFRTLNLTASQFSLLNDIHLLETCNKSELAVFAKLDRTTIVRNLRVLKEKKLIMETAGGHGRSTAIRLTALGESHLKKGLVLWEQIQRNIEQKIGPDKIGDFTEILTLLSNLGGTI
ncbi:MAG: hypothetical protein LBQ97_05630 [Fusobacteriaceae bacterium]|jgi:DNA-binding MarR family transcriptional regulator|nr:hypothetical protein [Fusobacteriaceae bacterium]